MGGVAGAVTAVAALAAKLWHYFAGEQTRADRRLEDAGEEALARAQVARTAHELNAADAELQRVQAAALARQRKP